jgi:hypothetical protein
MQQGKGVSRLTGLVTGKGKFRVVFHFITLPIAQAVYQRVLPPILNH